jgi:hypothetical protein
MATPIPLVIVCMRAKYPMVEVVKGAAKEWSRSTVLEPKQADDILFEMLVHGWIDREHNFHGTKYTRDDLREVIRDGERISIKTGEALAAWARGGAGGQSLPSRAVLLKASKDHPEAKAMGPDERVALRAKFCQGGPLENADEATLTLILDHLDKLAAERQDKVPA